MPRPRDPLEEERVRRLLEKAAALRALRAWMQKQGPTQPPGPAQLEAERAASARYAVPPEEVAGLQERARRSPALAPLEFSREALGGLSTPFRREPLPYGATEPPPDRTAWRRFLPPLEEPETIPAALGRTLGRGFVDPTMGEPLRGSLPEAVIFGLPLPTAGFGMRAPQELGQAVSAAALAARVKAPQAARAVAPTLKAMAREERGGARVPKKPAAPTPLVTKPVVTSETAPAIVKGGTTRPPVGAGDWRAGLNAADIAAEMKGAGIGRAESWSRWVQRTALRPGMDAKDWFKIYDSVTPAPRGQPANIPVGSVRPMGTVPAPLAQALPDPALADFGKQVEVKTRVGKNQYEWEPATIERTLNEGAVYEVRVANPARPFSEGGTSTVRVSAADIREPQAGAESAVAKVAPEAVDLPSPFMGTPNPAQEAWLATPKGQRARELGALTAYGRNAPEEVEFQRLRKAYQEVGKKPAEVKAMRAQDKADAALDAAEEREMATLVEEEAGSESAVAKVAPEAAVPTGQARAAQPAVLPRELAGAKPRFNIGMKSWEPKFESDVDRALFIVSQATPSKRNADYLGWLRGQFPETPDTELVMMGRRVRQGLKAQVQGQPTGKVAIPDTGIRPAGAESAVAKGAPEAAVPTGQARAPQRQPAASPVGEAATGGTPPPVKPQLTRVSPYPRQELTQPLLRDLRVVQGGTTPNAPRPPVRDIPLGQLEPRPGPVARPPEKTYTGPANVGAEWGEVQPRPPRRPLWAGTTEAVEATPGPAATSGGTPPKLPSGRKPPTIGEPPEGPRPFTPEEDLAILEKAVNPPKPGLWERATDVGRRKKAAWVDSNDPLVPLQRETGLPVHDLAQLSADAGGAGEELVRTQVLPILKPVSRDLDSLELYMVAKRNEDIMGRNPSARLPGGLQGWRGTLQAQQALEKKLGAQRFKAIQEAADALYAADRKHNLDLLRDEGFLDDKALTQITSAHPHYIPFDRADFINAIEGRGGGPASISSTGLQRMGLEGSERALDKPLASFVQKFILTQERVARNRAAKTLVQSLEEIQKRTGEEMLQFVEPSKEMRLAERVTGEKRLLSKSERSQLWEPVSYFENGQKVTVNVPAIYGQVAKGLNEEASNLLMKVGHYTTMPLRYGAIVYNPVWPAVNTIMNSTSAWFREGVIPLGPDFIRGIVAAVKKDELFSEVAGKGILMRGFTDSMKDMTSMERATRQVRLGAIRVKSPKDAALLLPRLAALVPKGIERASIATEQATRIAAYRKLKREGVGEIERAVRAKEVTIDFSKMGTTMRTVNAVLPFTNAALQGTLLAGRTIVRKPKWAAIAASPFIAASVMARVNNQRFETSKDIPSYEYSRNWVFQFGEGTRRDGTKFPLYFKVPKGPLASGLTFPAEALFGYFSKQGDRSIAGTVLEAAWEGAKTVSPIEPSMNAVVPPPISTGVGLSLKKDLFTGQDIIPRREQNLLPEQQFGPETSRQAVALGKKFHVSPRLIDWAIKDYTAGTGEAVMALEDLGLSAIGYQPEVYGGAVAETVTPVEEFSYQPGVRRFFGTKGTEGERQGWNEFNKTVDETNRRFNEQFPEMNNLGLRFGSVGDSIDLVPGKKGGSVDMTPQERAEFQLLTEKSIQYGFKNATGPSAKATPAEQRAYWQKQMETDRAVARLAMIEKLKRRILSGERVLTQKDRQELVAAK